MTVNEIILLLGASLLVSILLTKYSTRFGVPSLVLFMGLGLLIGRGGLEFLPLDDPHVAQFIGFIALAMILFEGGLRTHRETLGSVLASATSLSTVGVVITAAIVGVITHVTTSFSLANGLLIGAIVGSTDAAAVFSILEGQPIRSRLRDTLESESGLNDPVAIVLTVLLLEYNMTPGALSALWTVHYLVLQVVLGIGIGILFGLATHYGIREVRLESSGLYPLILASGALLTFGLTAVLGGSGFLAVYLMGVMITDDELPFRHSILVFQEGFAGLMQIVLFLMLGLYVVPARLAEVVLPGTVVALGLIFLARPLAVLVSLPFSGFSWREKTFLSWAGVRGAVPIVLGTYPLAAGLAGSQTLFHLVFFVVVFSALLQGWTVPLVARWLGVDEPVAARSPVRLELITPEQSTVDILEVTITEQSPLAGRTIGDLNLPEQSTICAVVREDKVVTPRGGTALQSKDVLFILVEDAHLSDVQKQLLEGSPTNS
jgi:cell volume regulation protein A